MKSFGSRVWGVWVVAGAVAGVGCQTLDRPAKPIVRTTGEDASGPRKAGEVRPLPKPTIPSEQQAPGMDALQKGKSLQQQGLDVAALAEFEKAIAENPLLTGAHMAVGDIQMKAGNFEKAEGAFGKAAQIEPRNFDAQYKHALVLQELKRMNDAIRAYMRALDIRPDDFAANANLGTAYLQAGEPQQALAYAKRAVELKPNDGPARANLGVVYQTLGRHDDAITEFQQAAELTELSPELLTNLADSYGRMHRYEEMVATLEQVVEMKPSAVAYERLGSGRFRLGLYNEALAAFRRSAELDQKHYPAHNGIGVCMLQQWIAGGQTDLAARDEGLKALRKSLQIEKNQQKVLELLTRYK